jgi:nucleoid-associated protein YgaU
LPINPPSIEIDSPFGFEDVEVSQLGEISIPKGRGLKSISFSSFFPKFYNPTYCEYADIPNPETALETIERWRDTKKPIRVTITGANVNLMMTIRNFNYEKEKAGNPGDIFYTMELKEFRYVVFNQIKITDTLPPSLGTDPSRPGSKVVPTSYTVKKGDDLWTIAARTYGSARLWPKIYAANKVKIGKNPNLIYPGQVLVIPK